MGDRSTRRRRRLSLLVVAVSVIAVTATASAAPASVATPATPTAGPVAPSGPAASPGCGTSETQVTVEEERHLDIDGSDRWFLLTVPGQHDGTTPLPVVVSFHGLSEGAAIHTLMTEWSGIAQREGFVVVFPQGRFDPVRWQVDPSVDPNEDLVFVESILDSLGQELCIDQSRVYASGLSFGAFMTSLVACKLSDRFAAVAPVAGILLTNPCEQSRSVPIVTVHGTDDPIVKFNGGFGAIPGLTEGPADPEPVGDVDLDGEGIPASVRGWAARNGCDPTPTDTQTSDEVLHRVYDCPAGADVEFYIVLGGGHSWPGSQFSAAIAPIVGPTTFDIHASEVAWEFFERFQLPCTDDQSCDDAPATTSTVPVAATPAVAPSFTG